MTARHSSLLIALPRGWLCADAAAGEPEAPGPVAFKLATKSKSLPLAEPVFPTPRLPSPPLQLEPDTASPVAKASSRPAKPSKDVAVKQGKSIGGSRWEKIPGQDTAEASKDRLKEEQEAKDKKAAGKDVKSSKGKESKPAKEKDLKAAKASKDKDASGVGTEKARESKGDKGKDADQERGRDRSPKKDKKSEGASKNKRKRSHSRYGLGNTWAAASPPTLLIPSLL